MTVFKFGILKRLIEMGKDTEIDLSSIAVKYADLKACDEINRLHWNDWDAVTANLSMEDLIALLKALTIAESRFRWCGGSVSSVIWVYREACRRDQEKSKELYEWVIRRTWNEYAPKGTSRPDVIPEHMLAKLDAMSSDERENWFLEFQKGQLQAQNIRHREKEERLRKDEKENQLRKQERIELLKQEQAYRLDRKAARESLLSHANALDEIGRLSLITEKNEYPIDFFPAEWANVSDMALAAMSQDLKTKLLCRIRDKEKGGWKELAKRLVAGVE